MGGDGRTGARPLFKCGTRSGGNRMRWDRMWWVVDGDGGVRITRNTNSFFTSSRLYKHTHTPRDTQHTAGVDCLYGLLLEKTGMIYGIVVVLDPTNAPYNHTRVRTTLLSIAPPPYTPSAHDPTTQRAPASMQSAPAPHGGCDERGFGDEGTFRP